MYQKQNYKFVLDRLYPEYFKPQPEEIIEEISTKGTKINKNEEEKRIETKLKTIIYNLQRQVSEERINSTREGDEFVGSMNRPTKGPFRSFSQKSIDHRIAIERFQTQIESVDYTQNAKHNEIIERLRKRSEKMLKKKQEQILILPKLTLKSRNSSRVQGKKSFENFNKPLSKNTKKYNIEKLEAREKQLGRIVLQKVERHFKIQKNCNKRYYDRVKSEQGIDQSLICYLKNKVMKANAALQR